MTDRYIELTQGQRTVVDEEDYEGLAKYKWCAALDSSGYYAVRTGWVNGRRLLISMARQILNIIGVPDVLGDHINGDTLNNRRNNLRIATNKQNGENRHTTVNHSSGIRGVSFLKETGKYRSYVRHNGRLIYLGYFSTLEEADQAAQAGRAKYFTPIKSIVQE